MRRQTYARYRPSSVVWLGDIPEHWTAIPVKRRYLIQLGKMLQNNPESDSDVSVPYAKALHVLWGKVNTSDLPEMWASKTDLKQFGIKIGDLLVCEGGEAGRAGIVDSVPDPCIIQNALHRVRGKGADVCFLQYVLQTVGKGGWFDVLCNKATIAHFTREKLAELRIPIPSIAEQRAIAAFLDRETERIDTLIEKKWRQIELLQEKQSALISHAVIKGLDPNAKMKDSGIEWMGKIPAHWGIRRLRYLGYCQNGINIGAEKFGTGYPFVSYTDVYNNSALPVIGSGLVESSDADRTRYSVETGDVFFTRTSETIEEIGFSSACFKTIPDAVFAGFLIRFRPVGKTLNIGFSEFYFRSDHLRAFFVKEMNLVTRASLSQDLLKDMPVLLPPIDEQAQIASILNQRMAQITSLIQKLQDSITKLQEHRTALISAAVTGKIDVRKEVS